MASPHVSPDPTALSEFHHRKILTLDALSHLLRCADVTSRRRLKRWRALTSYNHNNRYYTLPSIPTFDANGLWHYRGVSFSKHGTCKQTVINSPLGLPPQRFPQTPRQYSFSSKRSIIPSSLSRSFSPSYKTRAIRCNARPSLRCSIGTG